MASMSRIYSPVSVMVSAAYNSPSDMSVNVRMYNQETYTVLLTKMTPDDAIQLIADIQARLDWLTNAVMSEKPIA